MRHSNQMSKPPQLAPFDVKKQGLYSELPPDVRTFHPISKAEPGQSTEEAHFGHLYPQSHSFCHYLELMTIGEGWNINGLLNEELWLTS